MGYKNLIATFSHSDYVSGFNIMFLLLTDHKEKAIYPIDLKTTGKSVLNFRSAFMQWKYYLQASFYMESKN